MGKRETLLTAALVLAFARVSLAADANAGAWTIQGAASSAASGPATLGSLELAPVSSGSYAVTRTVGGVETPGHATLDANDLCVGYGSTGYSQVLEGDATPPPEDHYTWNATAAAWVGAHDGQPETLERRGGNSVEVIVDGGALMAQLLAAISSARQTLHIESYIWEDDAEGSQITNAVIERARAGVKVRAILDWAGSSHSGAMIDRMRASGVSVVWYNKLGLQTIAGALGEVADAITGRHSLEDVAGANPHALDIRDHRKAVIVDGGVAFVGGFCFYVPDIENWHDVHARLTGPAVADVQRNFLDSWQAGGGEAVNVNLEAAELFPALTAAGDSTVQVVTTIPGSSADLKALYLQQVQNAKTEILLETPYFSDGDLIAALEAAVARGVSVKLILPADSKNDVAAMGAYHAQIRPGLFAAGIELHDYPRMSHGKVALIDGVWSTIGSCNLDNRSFVRDREENLSVQDPVFGSALRASVFTPDLETAPAWKPSDEPRSLGTKALGFFAGLFHDLL